VGLVEIDSYKVSRQREGRTFNCFGKVYCIQLEDTPTQLETEDISEVRWFTPAELKRLVIEHPDQMTEGLRMVLDRNPDLL
jgi:hypothetical protein